jgi:phosphoglycolate phosphatase-like HAD superfamily hydrolase
VAVVVGGRPGPRAVIFDLDEVLLDRREAWRYSIEEAVASVCRHRPDVRPLVGEYRLRPWRDALAILLTASDERDRCEELCRRIYHRSALKRLLVHEGMGMALDRLRERGIEMGAISRSAHPIALKEIQATGLDRFLSVLAATPDGEGWDPAARLARCLAFLGYEAAACGFVSGDSWDLRRAAGSGVRCFKAAWNGPEAPGHPVIARPGSIEQALDDEWRAGRSARA